MEDETSIGLDRAQGRLDRAGVTRVAPTLAQATASAGDGCTRQKSTHKKLAEHFIASTSAHGLPKIFEKRNGVLTLFWTLIFLAAIGVSTWQIYELIQQFLGRDVNVRVEVKTVPSLTFPSVSVCNTNALRKSAIEKSKYRRLLAVDTEVVRPYYASQCLEGDFRCNNTGCIKSYLKCDGYDNCRDRSDEVGCQYGKCSRTQFKCTTGSDMGVCIDRKRKCDRILDCYGGEDEDKCDCKDKKEFSCETSGRCIPNDKLCNGVEDCPDGSDESSCTGSGTYCTDQSFKCDNNRKCIDPSYQCDGDYDCSDRTDEEGCDNQPDVPKECADWEYQCDAKKCIPLRYKCDGEEDCMTGSDERICFDDDSDLWTVMCHDQEFNCDIFRCIPNSQICDGEAQCSDQSDESPIICDVHDPTLFQCGSGEFYPLSYKCDGEYDCADGFDEDETECEGLLFTCVSDYVKIKMDYKCNSFLDCTDGSDEADCDEVTDTTDTPPEFFRCEGSGALIDRSQHCNKVVDCDDASDETNCQRGRDASHRPEIEALMEEYSHFGDKYHLFADFVEYYYDDHMFGRVASEDPPDWYGFITYSKTPDYSDLEDVLKLTKDEVRELGHQMEDFVLKCEFDGEKCDLESDTQFRVYQDEKYGNCFQFNYFDPESDVSAQRTTKPGAKYGLELILFTEQNEYISVYGRQSGARVVIKSPGIPTIPSIEGITVVPGMISSIGIKEKRNKRMPYPFGNCRTDVQYNSVFGGKYSKIACEEDCVQKRMLAHCGCVDTVMMNETRCTLLNRTQDVCKKLMYYLLSKNELGCQCPQVCEESWYETTVSQSLWPSDTYLKHLLKEIHFINNKTRDISDFTSASKNLVRLEVFFSELNYELIEEIPAITVKNLLSDVGGTLGLYCGFSFITVVEFLQFFCDLLVLTFARERRQRRNN